MLYLLAGSVPQAPDSLDQLVNAPPTLIYDAEGRVLYTLGGRDMTTIDRISPHFRQAIIAAEDKNFYRHHGLDKFAIIRSVIRGVTGKRRIAGGSTITQQLAKNLFFTFERDVMRKLKEMLAAAQIEATFSKEEILEAYCNQIPFGSRAYGIERAARTYFGISAAELTLAQAALLAGLPNSPSRYNPLVHPYRAKARQRTILRLMRRHGFIDDEQFAQAEAESLQFRPSREAQGGSWYIDRVIERCEAKFGGEAVYFGGLKIFTTLDPAMQSAAEAAVSAGLEELRQRLGSDSVQAALIAVSPLSGAVKAHIGGDDYRSSPYDRAVTAGRLPGSGFKPFLYHTALSNLKMNPASLVLDSAVTIPIRGSSDWSPPNYSRTYRGPVILKYALAHSINTVAARLVRETGPEEVVETARRFGVKSPLNPVPSIALGTSDVSPIEMAAGFSVIASGGMYYEPYFIERIESPGGETLYEHFVTGKRVADPDLIYLLIDMMKEVMQSGTAVRTRWSGFTRPACGKTGTTDDHRDSWFTGFTPNLSASVWIGFDQRKLLLDTKGWGITGSDGALPLWIEFMKAATEGEPPRDFPIPPGIKFDTVGIYSGIPADSGEVMSVALPLETVLPDTIRFAIAD